MGRMTQMEAMIQTLRNENLMSQQQQQQTLLQTAMRGPVRSVQIQPLIGVLADQVRVLSKGSRVNLIKQSLIADRLGENRDPTEQVDGYAQVEVQLKTVLAHLTEGESWSIVQNCG